MSRTLQTPVIKQPINAFDPSYDQNINIIYSDNQIKRIQALIAVHETGANVNLGENAIQITENTIQTTQVTMSSYFIIKANTLEAGKQYDIQIKVSDGESDEDANTNWSDYSEIVSFYCYSTPVLAFSNIEDGTTYKNSVINLKLNYNQLEGESLKTYQFQLYSNGTLLDTSNLLYYAESPALTHSFVLDNNASYDIKAIGETVHGMQLSTEVTIQTQFTTLPPNVVLNLENHKSEGYISIQTNILNVGYELYRDDATHYDLKNGILTLKNGNYLDYNKGYEIGKEEKDFSLFAEAKLLPLNKEFLICSYDKNPIFSLKIVNICGLYYCRLYDYNSELVLCKLLPNAKISTEDNSIVTSLNNNMLEVIDTNYNDNDFTIFEVKKNNGIYSLNVYYKSDATI